MIPEGNPWVMKSVSLIFDPHQTYEQLEGSRQPPEARSGLEVPGSACWIQDLVFLTPDHGIAHITQDDLGNTYDLAGGAYSNFKP